MSALYLCRDPETDGCENQRIFCLLGFKSYHFIYYYILTYILFIFIFLFTGFIYLIIFCNVSFQKYILQIVPTVRGVLIRIPPMSSVFNRPLKLFQSTEW